MKTIREAVRVNEGESRIISYIKEIYYCYLANHKVKRKLIELDEIAKKYGGVQDIRVRRKHMELLSVELPLRKTGLWNTDYNPHREAALEGKLNRDELEKVRVK
ncbi:Uncharacterised protein [uncultured archaeon]|nr:Uncharacterised protein [uncultured archaeon]